MPSFARIYLIGHVGNITPRWTPSGKQIINFSVAVNRYVNDEQYTDWYYVNTTQDWLLDELEVGDLVFIEGSPEMVEHKNQKYMNIWLNKIRILSYRDKESTSDNNIQEPAEPEIVESDEVPF